ncbi:MAG: hypothetical protein OXG97_02620 [Candidatus Poribacteria bacterium]|nr:hypothetical protein [Candidatus Poribacteria bacterium]
MLYFLQTFRPAGALRQPEDLEDILEMDSAVETATDFRDYQEIRSDLKREGKF